MEGLMEGRRREGGRDRGRDGGIEEIYGGFSVWIERCREGGMRGVRQGVGDECRKEGKDGWRK